MKIKKIMKMVKRKTTNSYKTETYPLGACKIGVAVDGKNLCRYNEKKQGSALPLRKKEIVTMRPEFIPVGQVVNAHGIRGEVKVNPIGFDPAFVASFHTLYIGGAETRVKSSRVHKSTVLLTLPGVEDMDAALALKGRQVSIRRTDAHLPEGEYFDAELLGLTVLDDDTGEELGKLTRVLNYPAHKVYEVKGSREYLIPAVRDIFIRRVDLEGETMRVKNMKGLATDEN